MKTSTLLLLGAALAGAQELPLTPAPRVLQIYRDSIRPGRQADYTKIETDAAAACGRLNFPRAYLALSAITGLTEVLFLNGYDTYTEMEQTGKAIAANPALTNELGRITSTKADLVNDARNVFAHFRADLSDGRGLSGPRTHLFSVSIVSVRPGHQSEYAEIRGILRSAHAHANTAEIHSVYEIASGMPEPTFLVFSPAASLEDVENSRILNRQRIEETLGEQNRKRLAELSASAILRTETVLFAIHPAMSFPAKEWVDADPEFWKVQQF